MEQPAEQTSLLETVDANDPSVANLLNDQTTAVELSTDFDIDKIIPLDDDDANDELYIQVDDPQQVGTGVSAYATYNVTGKCTLPGFNAEIKVRRRFADFQWLYEELLRNCQGYVVPPLPEFSIFNKLLNKFEENLLAYRARELRRFLRRVAIHPVLRNSTQLQAFLSEDQEFEQRKTTASATTAQKAGGMFGGFFGNVKKAVVSAAPTAVTGGPVEEKDEWFREKTAYITAVGLGLTSAGKTFHSLVESERSHKASLAMATEAASVMARSEAFDVGGESQRHLWEKAANALKEDHNALNDAVHRYQLEFEDVLHDYRRYVESVQIVLKYRFDKLTEMVAAERNLEAKKAAEKQDMGVIENAELALTGATATYERVTASAKEEIERFEKTKLREITKAINRVGQMQVAYHLKAADAYKTLFME